VSKKGSNSRLKIKINPAGIISLLILYLLNGGRTFAFITVSALVHELGHLFAMKLSRSKVSDFTVGFFNLNIKYNKYKTSYKTDIFISSAGPLFNLVFGIFAFSHGYTELFYANISLAVLNLLPFESLDGGNILRSIRCIIRGNEEKHFDAKMRLYGRIFAPSFVLLLSLASGFNVSVVFTGVSSLICKNINAS